jgi:hypothetical protein
VEEPADWVSGDEGGRVDGDICGVAKRKNAEKQMVEERTICFTYRSLLENPQQTPGVTAIKNKLGLNIDRYS